MCNINNYSKTPIEIDDSGFDVFIRHNPPQYFSEYKHEHEQIENCVYL